MKYFDYHTHTLEHKKNASLHIRETIQAGIEKHLSVMCLTDHLPLPPDWIDPTEDKDCSMSSDVYKTYQSELNQILPEVGQNITILQGAEVDWIPSRRPWTQTMLTSGKFAYCIGSVHFIDTLLIDYTKEMWQQAAQTQGGIQSLIRAYYAEVRAMISSKLFQTVGHIDLIKKFNDGESLFSEREPWYQEEVLLTLDQLKVHGMIMEINTAGWLKACKDAYPSQWIVDAACSRDIPITTGSDAHIPEYVGYRLSDAVSRAKKAGYRTIVYYQSHQRQEVQI